MDVDTPLARHRARVPRRAALFVLAVVVSVALVVVAVVTASRAVTSTAPSPTASPSEASPSEAPPLPVAVTELPVPEVHSAQAANGLCASSALATALAAGDETAAIAAVGGAEPFRAAVAAGTLPCVDLSDPETRWFVVNKSRPFPNVQWAPSDLAGISGVTNLNSTVIRAEASQALVSLVDAIASSGAGEVALLSGYRSYGSQVETFEREVDNFGREAAENESARPGFSEHQSGLAVDLVPCNGGSCLDMDAMKGSAQSAWLLEHAWEHGWIVRYEEGQTAISGYIPEAWHFRYIGTDLAAAYHAGGYHTLEEFFGLPAAPDYVD